MSAFKSTIVITGGTTGLGYWAAYELACKYPDNRIIIASRSDKQGAAQSLTKLLQRHRKDSSTAGSAQLEYLSLDLASTTSVRAFVSNFASKSYPPISRLLLNAGLQFYKGKDIRYSPDGVESTFAVNHLGHALLLFLLKPYLAPDLRIIVTASGTHDPAKKTLVPDAHYESAELLAHPTDKQGYEIERKGIQRYASSKLANVLFTYALERRLKTARDASKGAQWTVCAFDPGLMPGTALGRDAPAVVLWIFQHVATHLVWLLRMILRSPNVYLPQESGKNLANLAAMSGEKAISTSGQYWEGPKDIPSSTESYNEGKQEDLWKWTVEFLARDEEEKKAFETF